MSVNKLNEADHGFHLDVPQSLTQGLGEVTGSRECDTGSWLGVELGGDAWWERWSVWAWLEGSASPSSLDGLLLLLPCLPPWSPLTMD